MAELATGTVTLLFTDIEGSTRLLHELGERYAECLPTTACGARHSVRGAGTGARGADRGSAADRPPLALFARLALQQGDNERAGRLWGALEAEAEREPMPGWTPKESIHARAVLALSGTEEFERGGRGGGADAGRGARGGQSHEPAID